MQPAGIIALPAALFSLLFSSVALHAAGFAAPWYAFAEGQTGSCSGASVSISLISACAGGSTVPFPTSSVYFSFGVATTALLALACACAIVALFFSGVALQRVCARAPGAGGDFARKLPALARGCTTALPCALVGLAWAACVSSAGGLAVGNYMFASLLLSAYSSPAKGASFPGRDATSAALACALAAAVLATVAADRCCCCRRAAGSEPGGAPELLLVNPMAAAVAVAGQQQQATAWVQETDGDVRWYVCEATGETAWTLPPGAVVVA